MPIYKVMFRKEFEIFVEAPSTEAIRKGFQEGNFPDDHDWGTGIWKMFSDGPVEQRPNHFLTEGGDIRHIDDKRDHESSKR
jgi:hypothetical protein